MANLSSYLPGGIDPSAVTITGGTINGTSIGASTAAAGTFTTFTSTGIDDNATSTAITIDSSQRVGIGTSSPTDDLHVLKSGNSTLRVESSGTATQSSVWTENDSGRINGVFVYGSLHSSYGAINSGEGAFYSNGPVNIMSDNPSGAIKFSIGGSGGSERMRIDSSGNVGIGTTSPNEKLVSSGTVRALGATTSNESSTTISYNSGVGAVEVRGPDVSTRGSLNLYQAASNGSLGQTALHINSSGNVGIGTASPTNSLDVGGNIYSSALIKTNRANAASSTSGSSLELQIDGTTYAAIRQPSAETLAFYRGNGGTTETMRIDASGNLLVGKTTDPTVGIGQYIKPTGETFHTVNNSYNTLHVYNVDASAFRFYVGQNGTVHATNTSISAISDASLKENVRDLDKGLDAVLALKPRRFDWKNGDGNDIMGFIAQEVEEVMPELIDEAQYNKDETKKSLKMGDMIPSMVKAIQEQQAMIEELKAEVAALKGA